MRPRSPSAPPSAAVLLPPPLAASLPTRVLLVLLLVAALTGCSGSTAPLVASGATAPKPTPTPTATPEPRPLPRSTPFRVPVTVVRSTATTNSALFGAPVPPHDQAAANRAVDAAAALLRAYLDAQLVDPATRLSDAGIAAALGPVALDPEGLDAQTRLAFGNLAAERVLGTATGEATAEADVLIDGAVVEAVVLTYTATAELTVLDGDRAVTGPLTQTGVASFAPLQGVLSPVAWVPTTTFGGDLEAVLG